MNDLFENAESKDTAALVAEYYQKSLDNILKRNKELAKIALDTNVAGGYVETYYARGVMRKDFATPLAQAITAEEMANDGYFSQILTLFSALCSEVKTELKYKNKELMNDPLHKKIFDFVNTQLDSIGGYETIFERVIKPSLRWGTGIGYTVLKQVQFDGKMYVGLESLKTVNLQNVVQFIFEEEDPSRLDGIRFLTYPKMINTELLGGLEVSDNLENTGTTEVNIKTLNIKTNCAAVTAHNAVDGNPLGLPYLYFLYPIWKTYKAMLEGTYNSMISFGQYPIGIKRNSSESGKDGVAWENYESAKLQEIIALGGAPYVSSEGEMYKLDPPDVEKLMRAEQMLYDMASRASGLGQITMGIQGGGSRDLMESIDVLTDKHIKATIKSSLIDISETLIRNLVRINFAREWRIGLILETPKLTIKEKESEVISNSMAYDTKKEDSKQNNTEKENMVKQKEKQSKKESIKQNRTEKTKANTKTNIKQKPKHNKTLIEKAKEKIKKIAEKVKQAMTVNTYSNQKNNNTEFEILVNKPSGVVSEILIDIPGLDSMLVKNRNELAAVLEKRLTPLMKDLVKVTVENPTHSKSLWSSSQKKLVEKEIEETLESLIYDSSKEYTKLLENSLKLGNQTWVEVYGNVSMEEYSNKIADKYIKSPQFDDVVKTTLADAENSVFNYLNNSNKSFVSGTEEQKQNNIIKMENQIEELKGLAYKNMAEDATMKTYNNFTTTELEDAGKKLGDKYVMIRHTAAEKKKNICSVCFFKENKIYYYNENSNKYIARDGEVAEFPDPECKGTKGGHTCRCGAVLVPVSLA